MSRMDRFTRGVRQSGLMRIFTCALLTGLAFCAFTGSAAAATYVPINGVGSIWAQNAMNQWTSAVAQYGMPVQYAGVGSSAGKAGFYDGLVDYAVTDLSYGGPTDPPPTQPFEYVPVTASGVVFAYHLSYNSQEITDLRLSPATVAGIFTGTITEWNDPAIEADNPGVALPALRITPVVRSDSAAPSEQLTQWLATEEPTAWNAYCAKVGLSTPCGATSFFPSTAEDVSQSLDSGTVGYVAESTSDGAITYTETSYALQANLPMASLLNHGGYYVAPSADAVAVALTDAQLDQTPGDPPQFADLSGAIADTDPRAYPLVEIGYLIVPTSTTAEFTTAKGLTLSTFADYAECQGQQTMAPLGYAPLPINLVEAGFSKIDEIPGAVAANNNIASCNNPTFSTSGVDTLLANAPQPPPCDAYGSLVCGTPYLGVTIETLSTALPPGALVISVPDNATVTLPSPVLDPSAQFFSTSGPIDPMTVTDNRAGDPGWTIVGQITDFTDSAGQLIGAQDVGWTPTSLSLAPGQTVALGPVISPGTGGGLSSVQTLAIGTGLGSASLGATLDLYVPTTTLPGTYSATLTLTAI